MQKSQHFEECDVAKAKKWGVIRRYFAGDLHGGKLLSPLPPSEVFKYRGGR